MAEVGGGAQTSETHGGTATAARRSLAVAPPAAMVPFHRHADQGVTRRSTNTPLPAPHRAAGTAATGAGHVRCALLRRRGWRWPPHRGRGAGRGTVTAVTRGRWERGVRRPGGSHSGGGVGGEIVGVGWGGEEGKEQGRRWRTHRLICVEWKRVQKKR